MRKFDITGMSCAACSARVEKAVSALPGVDSCAVSLLTNTMGVEGSASSAEIIRAVEKAGYGAKEQGRGARTKESALKDSETPALLRRLIASVVVLLPLLYLSMGHMMWRWPLPPALESNHLALALLQMILAAVIAVINNKFFISGFRAVLHGSPNMDTLVSMGSGIAFLYSVYLVFAMTGTAAHSDTAAMMKQMEGLQFEASAMILTLITVGKTLEAFSKGRTTSALKGLMDLSPKTAVLLRDGREQTVPVEEVRTGDVFILRPGQSVPVDGVVLEGESAVNESALTGESVPADKAPGDRVFAGTVNYSGHLTCRALRVGEDTTLAEIIRMVNDASATKAPIARIADRVAGVFVPAVIAVAAVTFAVWMIAGKGQNVGYALERAIAVLVISCPCALGLATPVAIMAGSGVGAKNGILYKTSEALEVSGKTQIAVLDKTGTVTKGLPAATDLLPYGVTEEELLLKAAALEKKSEHPLARAVVTLAEERGVKVPEVSSFLALPGSGVRAILDGRELTGGKRELLEKEASLPAEALRTAETLANEGKTPLFFAENGKYIGTIAVEDAVREESPEAVAQLRGMGVRTVLLTGDNERTAKAVGARVGADEVIAGVLPGDKERVVSALKACGRVMMIGDGINDAPALTSANVGTAVGAGADVAVDAADVVLVNSSLTDVPACIRLGRRTVLNIYENLFWAFIYNLIGIPLAAGLFIPIFGWELPPAFGAAAMSLSSFCVVMNALRLNFVKVRSSKRDRQRKPVDISPAVKEYKEKAMYGNEETLTMFIEGMMCPHCEATVRKTLEAFDSVESAEVSREKGTAVVRFKGAPAAFDELKKAVEDKGYTVK